MGHVFKIYGFGIRQKAPNVLSSHSLFTFVELSKRYFNDAFKTPVSKPRLVRQTENIVTPRVFTTYSEHVHDSFMFVYL